MDSTTPEILLYFILGFATLVYLLLYRFIQDEKNLPLPPGSLGWPIVGETLELQSLNRSGKPDDFMKERMKKYNHNAFKTSILGEKTIAICGAEGNKFVFTSEKHLVLTWWPTSLKKLFGEAFFTAPYDEATRTRKMVTAFLHQEVMHQLVERFDKTCKKCFQSDWIGRSNVKAFSLIKKYAFMISCEMFTSIDNAEWQEMILTEFNVLLKGVFQLPIYFPGTRHYKAVKSAKTIRRELIKLIEKKRMKKNSSGAVENDLISHLIDVRDDDGKHLSDKEIVDNVILLMDAGHDTVSAALMMSMKCLAERSDCYQLVLEEQRGIAKEKKPGELLNKDDLQRMKYSWNVVSEVLRLSPPIQGTFRKAIVDCTYAGFSIPKGWMIWWVAASTHKDAKCFPDPENFDPLRFDRDTLTPYSYVPFGGGPRMCPGKEFARVEILVFLHNLVNHFRWELEFPNEIIGVDPMPTSSLSLPVNLFPHE